MTTSNGNIFRVTGYLCGEFTGHRWIPLTNASGPERRCFIWSVPWINGWVNTREVGDLRRHHAHHDVIVMVFVYKGKISLPEPMLINTGDAVGSHHSTLREFLARSYIVWIYSSLCRYIHVYCWWGHYPRSFNVFFDLRPNKRLSKQWWGWWFETQSCPLWRQCNAILIFHSIPQHWNAIDCSDFLSGKAPIFILHTVNIMAADDLAMQGTRTSAAKVLIYISRIVPVSCICISILELS